MAASSRKRTPSLGLLRRPAYLLRFPSAVPPVFVAGVLSGAPAGPLRTDLPGTIVYEAMNVAVVAVDPCAFGAIPNDKRYGRALHERLHFLARQPPPSGFEVSDCRRLGREGGCCYCKHECY